MRKLLISTLLVLVGCAGPQIPSVDEVYTTAQANCLREEPVRIDKAERESAYFSNIEQRSKAVSEAVMNPHVFDTIQERIGASIAKYAKDFNERRAQIPATCSKKADVAVAQYRTSQNNVTLPVVFVAPLY